MVEEEEIIVPKSKAGIFEDAQRSSLEDDEPSKRRTTVIDERVIESPVVRSVFDAADDSKQIAEKPVKEDALRNYEYIELDSVTETEPVEEPVLIKRVSTTIIEDDEVVLQVTEEQRETLPVVEEVVIADEPKSEPEDKPKIPVNISTIPMDPKGNIIREEPMIPTIPPMAAKGVGSNAAELPFVLPATEEGRKTMADYNDLIPKEEEPSFESALRQAQDIPVAPMIDIDGNSEPAAEEPAPAPSPAPETPKSNVIMADADVEINFNEPEEPAKEPTPEPEVIPEPEEEPTPEIVPEPEEEPVPEEPEIIPEPVEEPEEEPVYEEPVFTDAEHADELMTDEEAEEHIEIIEEAPDRERTGKMHAINLDTLCESYEDGEEVTLESLKEKKLAPKNAGRVKILARGTMTKKLDIIADNFSLQAVKMITLAGGRAEQYK